MQQTTPSAQQVQTTNATETLAKPQVKRQAGSFALYMKENYSQVKNLPNKERLKALSEKYKSQKK